MKNCCPICGDIMAPRLVFQSFNYKGNKFSIPEYPILECNGCVNFFINTSHTKWPEIERTIKEFQKEMDKNFPYEG